MGYLSRLFRTFSESLFRGSASPSTLLEGKDLSGTVALVTGGTSGCGLETVRLLAAAHAKVYIAARTESTALEVIEQLKSEIPSADISYHKLDLSDLNAVHSSAKEFLKIESRLDLLINNAGVMQPPKGTITAQGYEMQFGTNVIGHYLFTVLLLDLLKKTANGVKDNSLSSPFGTRIVFLTSTLHHLAPEGLIPFDDLSLSKYTPFDGYAISKAGDMLLAKYFNRILKDDNIISLAVHPGLIYSQILRHSNAFSQFMTQHVLSYPTHYGSVNTILAATSPDYKGGEYIIPWGAIGTPRPECDDEAIQQRLVDYCNNEATKLNLI